MDKENVKTLARSMPSLTAIKDMMTRSALSALNQLVLHILDYIADHEDIWVEVTQQNQRAELGIDELKKALSKHTHPPDSSYRLTGTEMSLTDAEGIASLDNDTESPGNNKVYGTDATGAKGWQAAGAGAVTSIVAGTNITISPAGGTGDVTVNSAAGAVDAIVAGSRSTISPASGLGTVTITPDIQFNFPVGVTTIDVVTSVTFADHPDLPVRTAQVPAVNKRTLTKNADGTITVGSETTTYGSAYFTVYAAYP